MNGRWHAAIEVPGTAALNKSGWAQVNAVSCGSAGNRSALRAAAVHQPDRRQRRGHLPGVRGQRAERPLADRDRSAPGTPALNKGGWAQVPHGVVRGSAGNCSGRMLGTTGSDWDQQAFVASEVNGRWHAAIEIPGTAALNKGGNAQVSSVSCGSAGHCSAGGYYQDSSSSRQQVFVASEVNGSLARVPPRGARTAPSTRAGGRRSARCRARRRATARPAGTTPTALSKARRS